MTEYENENDQIMRMTEYGGPDSYVPRHQRWADEHKGCGLVPDPKDHGTFWCPEHKVGSIHANLNSPADPLEHGEIFATSPACNSPCISVHYQYGQMISREGTGADAGGQADPLVQEPTE